MQSCNNVSGNNDVQRMTADSTADHALDTAHRLPFNADISGVYPPFIGYGERKCQNALMDEDESDSEDCKSVRTDTDANSSGSARASKLHKKIEKRRRDKMNLYINEISSLIPMCATMSRKQDKLTVLKYAVQHIKGLRGTVESCSDEIYKPSCVSEEELNDLIEQSSEGFLLAISCDRGKIIHVSESVERVLGWQAQELSGKSCFDIVQKDDASKLKEQMISASTPEQISNSAEAQGSEYVTSSTCSQNVSMTCFCPGAKRFFHCRMKRSPATCDSSVAGYTKSSAKPKFVPVRCKGFLKIWPTGAVSQQDMPSTSSEADCTPSFACLILNVIPLTDELCDKRSISFTSRLTLEAKFVFIEQSICSCLGYFPQDLKNQSYYDYVHEDDLVAVSELHNNAITCENPPHSYSDTYRLRNKFGYFIPITADWRCFKNPWTKEQEFLAVSHKPASNEPSTCSTVSTNNAALLGLLSKLPQSNRDGKSSNTRIGAGNIGKLVAERRLDGTTHKSQE